MTALLLQTILMMTIAYFIGAALACGLRRMLSQDAEPLPAQPIAVPAATAAVAVAKGAVDPLPEFKAQPKPAPAPAPAPAAVRPTPAAVPVAKPAPLPPSEPGVARFPASPSNGNRFDDALAGKIAPVPVAPAAKPAPVAAPPAPKPVVAQPAPAPVAAPKPAAPVAPPPPAQKPAVAQPTTAETVAAAAAIAAAAAAASAVAKPAAAAPVAPVATAPAKDDLTLISNIDKALESELNKIGVTRFGQIAGWMRPDVLHIDQLLKQKNRVEHENWIEQAQILASGKDTAYSALVKKGQRPAATAGKPDTAPQPAIAPLAKPVASPAPVAAAPVAAAPVAPKPAAPAAAPAPQPAVTAQAAAQAAAAIAAAAAAASTVAPPKAPPPSAPTPAATAPASVPRVEDRAAFAAETKPAPAKPVAAPPPAAVVEPPAAKPIPSVAVSERDDLQRISGVNAEIERLLAFHNVTRYQHIASWSSADIEKFDDRLGSRGRIARENWVEQAQILSRGGDTAYSREYDRRRAGVSPDAAARPSRLSEAIKANAPAGATPAPAANVTAQRNDIGVLRSVRSEMYRPVDEASTTAAAAAAAAAGSARVVRGSDMDDLKRIRGIGVLIEKKLNSLGVYTYAQIAEWTSGDIEAMSQKLDFKGRIERENWVEQARILSSGGQTEFSRRVDRGEVETSRKPS